MGAAPNPYVLAGAALDAKRTVADDIDGIRKKLAGRRDDCVDRLQDAVSELYALHSLGREEIIAYVLAAIEGERSDPAPEPDER